MTVTYTAEVATCKKFGCFIKLLWRWRGSIYKLIWMDLLLFLTLYYCVNMIYIYLLEDESKRTFESIVYYCASYTSLIPLSFVLGFYVNLVMTRWWEQYTTIPWPDSIAVFVSAHVHGQDEASRVMRRTVMRYVCLCLTIVFTMISPGVKKRFPKLKNLVDAGLLLENEKQIIESMDNSFPKYPKHWMPIVWAASIITGARKEGHIRDDFAVKTIIDELNSFRGLCGTLMYYDFISIPLVYTQVVTIAVYSFFICSLLAHQWTESKRDTYEALDFYSPVFITLQFFFYMGWLKVAETLINPFGEDDDDFEVNWMIDRNLQVSYLIVDEMHHEHPELVKDQYWDEVYPNELPYEADAKREQPPEPSTAKYDLASTPKRVISKVTSPTNSTVMNGKVRTSIQSALNQRSQRFNEAFQRFFNITDDDESSIRTDVENSFQSISEIENITSYSLSDQVELETESHYILNRSALEPVPEEDDINYEVLEEDEMENMGEEEDEDFEIEESSGKNDSDSDPFERLRIERQLQRIERMNNYLNRHFGPNFQITTDHLYNHQIKTDFNKTENIIEDNIDMNASNEDIHTISTNNIHQNDNEINLIENDIQLEATKSDNVLQQDAEVVDSFILEDINIETTEVVQSKETINPTISAHSIASIETQFFSVNIEPDNIKYDAQISNITISQHHLSSSNLETTGELPEPGPSTNAAFEPEMKNIESNAICSIESGSFWKSKATSPLGSPKSVSTQSSFVDDWEILSSGTLSSAGERDLSNKESEDKVKTKKE